MVYCCGICGVAGICVGIMETLDDSSVILNCKHCPAIVYCCSIADGCVSFVETLDNSSVILNCSYHT